jgi:hypothetical protein
MCRVRIPAPRPTGESFTATSRAHTLADGGYLGRFAFRPLIESRHALCRRSAPKSVLFRCCHPQNPTFYIPDGRISWRRKPPHVSHDFNHPQEANNSIEQILSRFAISEASPDLNFEKLIQAHLILPAPSQNGVGLASAPFWRFRIPGSRMDLGHIGGR